MGLLSEKKTIGLSAANIVNLQIGDVCCAFYCHDDEVCDRLRKLYGAFLTEQLPDITIELEATDRLSPRDLDKALSRTRFVHDKKNRFRTTSKIMSGQYDLENRIIKIIGEKSLVNPELEINHLNRLLSLAYYSACKVKFGDIPPEMLVHAAGVLRHGQVWLFTGPSEAGKTTVASLCRKNDGEVINDEILLVSQSTKDDSVSIRSAPILGKFIPQSKVTGPLRGIFMLKQSHRTLIHHLDRTKAYLKLMRQIITPAYIGQINKREVLSLIADFSNEITRKVPVYELEFTLDGKSLWQAVGELEGVKI